MSRVLETGERNKYIDKMYTELQYVVKGIRKIIGRDDLRIGTRELRKRDNDSFNFLIGQYIGLFRQYMDCLTDEEKAEFIVNGMSATEFLQDLLCSTIPPVLNRVIDPRTRTATYENSNKQCEPLYEGVSDGYYSGVKQLPDSARKLVMEAVVNGRDIVENGGAGRHIVKSIRDGRLTSFRGLEKIEVYKDGVTGYEMEDVWSKTKREMEPRLRKPLDRQGF